VLAALGLRHPELTRIGSQIRKSPAAPAVAFPYEVQSSGVVFVGDARDAAAPGAAVVAAEEDGGAAFFNN
jgi:hypothetical protein